MKFSSILLLSLGLVSGAAMAGGTTEAGVGGALGNYMGNDSDRDDRRYRDRDRDDRRYYRDGHPGRGHAYGHRKNKHRYRD